MKPTTVQRLYFIQVGLMPEYQIPVVCYLVQTDHSNILIDTGLPEVLPEGETEFANGVDVVAQLALIGLGPSDIDTVVSTHYDGDHAGRHGAFPRATYVVQRAHHADAQGNPRYAFVRPQWDQGDRIRLVDGDTELVPGVDLIETSGHAVGHQSVVVRLPRTGTVLLAVDAVPFAPWFAREDPPDSGNPDPEGTLPSTLKLLDLVERESVDLVVFGHDPDQWKTLRLLPEAYD